MRKMALLQVSGGFEAGEPNSESISRSAIAELIVRSSFSARRSVWGARFDAVEKSNLFGFMFVMTIESPEAWSSPKRAPRRLRGLDRGDAVLGPDARAPLLEADLFFDCEGDAAPRGGLGGRVLEDGDARPAEGGRRLRRRIAARPRRCGAPAWASRASSSKITGVGRRRRGPLIAAGAAASSSKIADRPGRRFVGDAARVVVEDRELDAGAGASSKMANG